MCGIWAYFSKQKLSSKFLGKLNKYFNNLIPRGPERSRLINLHFQELEILLGFHRLSIIDTSHKSDQPFLLNIDQSRTIYTLCNGEIYNFKKLIDTYDLDPNLKNESDCKIIQYLYVKLGIEKLSKELIGEFAFIILDITPSNIMLHVSRDPLGVRPLYISYDSNGLYIGSELKGSIHTSSSQSLSYTVNQILGGCYTSINLSDLDLSSFVPEWKKFYNIDDVQVTITDLEEAKELIYNTLSTCVIDRLMADVPIGFLLSGGVDSSLICGIASKYLKQYGKNINTFSCGLDTGSTDEPYAKMVAEYIGSNHTHVVFKSEDFIKAIPNIIYTIETYDITSVRASVAQYMICNWIKKNTDIKVLYCGDGSDELTKGYKYNHLAPSVEEAHNDTLRLLKDIIYFDGKRADRGIANNGIEARVPFLDYRFVNAYLSIDPKLTMPTNKLEKWLLRESFKEKHILPEAVLFRSKEAFSDGVSTIKKSWFEMVQDEMNEKYNNIDITTLTEKYPFNTPPSKEALYYREEFEKRFNSNSVNVIPYFWLPKWVGNIKEPSARILEVYK
jgi:asparagine synthase (glutamine-hydrolysing)